MTKKILLNPWLALATLAVLLLVRWLDPAFVESVRLRYFDQLIVAQQPAPVPVHVVNIDEAALDQHGQWPFERGVYAKIIDDLYARDAGLVVWGVLMPEADRFRQDAQLAQTLEQHPVVLPSVASVANKNRARASASAVIGGSAQEAVIEYPGLISNVATLEQAAAGVGIVNTLPEIDGVVRRMPLVAWAAGDLRPSLALETLRVAAGDANIQVKVGPAGVEALRVPKFGRINTDGIGRIWIDWRVQPQSHSLASLPQSFNREIVIVGLSAAGLVNPIATARGEAWPQTVHASVLGTVLTGNTIQRPAYADTLELAVPLALAMMLIALMRWTYVGIAATVFTVAAVILGSVWLYTSKLWLFDATMPALTLLLVALHSYMAKFVSEFLQKQQIRKQFQSYLSPDLVAKLIKDPSLLKLGGEEKELSIMFTDVRGFTSISEHYGRDVQGLTKIMNRYMTAMTRQILENDGTLDKYIGDAQMAFWNAPLDETQHCKDAVRAALNMLDDLVKFNEEITAEGVPAFGMGLGINTGIVVVGNMGSEQRFDYTCLGDAVNLASRLEGQSKNYGVKIVLGPVTAARLGGEFFTVELDCIAVKGKTEGVTIYTVFRNPADQAGWQQARELHELMLEYYRKQQWDRARELVNSLVGEFGGGLNDYYELWLERITEMESAELPADWDGIFRANSK
jgi:adenylate cyclase